LTFQEGKKIDRRNGRKSLLNQFLPELSTTFPDLLDGWTFVTDGHDRQDFFSQNLICVDFNDLKTTLLYIFLNDNSIHEFICWKRFPWKNVQGAFSRDVQCQGACCKPLPFNIEGMYETLC
tara:strand:- start:2475 stop:2837 length:363 start_codon:yes stop_codon:yes gene_type:complete